ncbi:hypothetical protein ACA910_002140 [Epithemia clementina (nom. ined.)]
MTIPTTNISSAPSSFGGPPNHSYRAALALNNMATTLMQRGCYSAARITLNDSLTMMQMPFVVAAPTTSGSCCGGAAEGQQQQGPRRALARNNKISKSPEAVLRAASQRYCQAISEPKPPRPLLVYTAASGCSSSFPWPVVVTPIDDDNVSDLRCAVVEKGPSQHHVMVFPIRMSGLSACDEADTHEITKQFGIILYNQGLVNFLLLYSLSTTTTLMTDDHSSQQKEKYQERALKFLKKAKATFVSVLTGHDGKNNHEEDDEEMRANSNHHESPVLPRSSRPSPPPPPSVLHDPVLLLLSALTLNLMCVIFHFVSSSSSSPSAPQEEAPPEQGQQDLTAAYNNNHRFLEAQQAVSYLCISVDEIEFWWSSRIPQHRSSGTASAA